MEIRRKLQRAIHLLPMTLRLFVGCLMTQPHVGVVQGRVCLDNCTCCHTETEVADQTMTAREQTQSLPMAAREQTQSLPMTTREQTQSLPMTVTKRTLSLPMTVTERTLSLPMTVTKRTQSLPMTVRDEPWAFL